MAIHIYKWETFNVVRVSASRNLKLFRARLSPLLSFTLLLPGSPPKAIYIYLRVCTKLINPHPYLPT